MEEDDLDFTPNQSTSSNLSSLFGFTKKPLQGNPTLTYTAPKAPKSQPSSTKTIEVKSSKGSIIFSKAVKAYKLENRTYVSQGLTGIVINAHHESHLYAIILYKPTKEHLSSVTITKTFSLILCANNYISFYDKNKENWSVMFESAADVEQFVEKVTICKFYSHVEHSQNILVQDLTPLSNVQATSSSVVDITYSSFTLNQESLSVIKENIHEKITLSSLSSLAKSLIGCSENSKRIVIVPHSLSDEWVTDLDGKRDLLFKIKVEKVTSQLENSLLNSMPNVETTESPVDSSTEDGVKAKEVTLKEAIANTKSQKANLISRMAKMGQATLPLRQELTSGPSDSEEESLVASPKPRASRNTSAGINSHQYLNSMTTRTPVSEAVKQLSVYQNDLTLQHQLSKFGVPHQLIPVASPNTSPTTDCNMSLYVSESRIQATELRMGIAKISDKMDMVLNKIQSLNVFSPEVKANSPNAVDSSSILSGIQNLITENESLREKVEDQKTKLEEQNDRIFHLLQLNHKYLEQNATSFGKQSETELKLKKEIEMFERKEIQLEADNKKYLEKVKSLEEELEKSENAKKKMKQVSDELSSELDVYKKNMEENSQMKEVVESYDEKLLRASEIVTKLKQKLKEFMAENKSLKALVETKCETIETNKVVENSLKLKNEEYEKTVEILRSKILENESQYETTINNLKSSMKQLEEKGNQILTEKDGESCKYKVTETVNEIFTTLKDNFSDSSNYTSTEILSILKKCSTKYGINLDTFDGTYQQKSKVETVVPEPTASIQNLEIVKEEENDLETLQCEFKKKQDDLKGSLEDQRKEPINSDKEKDVKNALSEKKSYDQGWRTAKPPPPPLFDDEEDDDDWLN